MELIAKLLPQMIEMHKGNPNPMLDEAYKQGDYDSVGFLYCARKYKDRHQYMYWVAKFYMHHSWKLDAIEAWHKTMLNSVMIGVKNDK